MCIFIGASLLFSAWRSVLTAMNSTPRSLLRIIRFTALLPPPPIPTTLMRAFPSRVRSMSFTGSSSRISILGRCGECASRAPLLVVASP